MAAVNTSLKLLGTPATAATSKAQLEQAATRAMAALEALRGLREAVPALKTKPLDAEKAAGALVSALLAQGMVSVPCVLNAFRLMLSGIGRCLGSQPSADGSRHLRHSRRPVRAETA